MDKLAQQRGYWNKLREKANISGRILETINPEFGKMMDKLRSTDDRVRQNASELKNYARDARIYLKKRDYLNAANSFTAFHQKAKLIATEFSTFNSTIDLKHYEFLLSQLTDEQKDQLFKYDPEAKLSLEKDDADDGLNKAAGITDWLVGRKTSDPAVARSSAMKAFEKRFSVPFMKKLKTNTIVMADRTDHFLLILLSFLKKLAPALATRHIDQYVALSVEFLKHYNKYHSDFVKYYNINIIPIKEQNQKLIDAQKEEEGVSAPMPKQQDPVSAVPKPMAPPSYKDINKKPTPGREMGAIVPGPEALTYKKPISMSDSKSVEIPPFSPGRQLSLTPQKEETLMYNKQKPPTFSPGRENPFLDNDNLPIQLTNKKSNEDFINMLEKYASDDNTELFVSEVLKYSEELENTNPEDSLKLLAIAEGIIEDYKTAGIFDLFKKEDKPAPAAQEKQPDPLA
jgi:hypothetical protein